MVNSRVEVQFRHVCEAYEHAYGCNAVALGHAVEAAIVAAERKEVFIVE